jgi:hypothetical protein
MIMGQEIPIGIKVGTWLRTLKQCFLLKHCFLPQSTNIAYERCYFPQTLLSGENIAKQAFHRPHVYPIRKYLRMFMYIQACIFKEY